MIFRTHPRLTLLLAVGVTCGAFIPLAAGPALQEYRQLADEERAFANIDRLQIEVLPLPKELETSGLRSKKIREQVAKACRAANITITDDASAPKLVITSTTKVNDRHPDTVVYAIFLDLVQRTHLIRLDEELLLPTATYVLFAGKAKDKLAGAVHDSVDEGIAAVLNSIDYASKMRQ